MSAGKLHQSEVRYMRGGSEVLIVDKEPIHFRDDATIKIDEGGVAFTIPSSMNNLGLCIMQRTWCVGNGQLDQARLSDKVGALNCMHDQQAILREREREEVMR